MPSADTPRLDHVAIAVARLEDALEPLVAKLGARPAGAGPGLGFRFWQWHFDRGATLEVLQPDGEPGGFLHRFLAQRGPGVHHVTFKVPDIHAAMARAEGHGYEIVGAFLDVPAWKEAFLHPRQAQGIVVQLAEAHPELEPDDWSASHWPFPELPPAAPAPARLVGVRLVAHAEARARHQWEQTLLGACETTPDALVFRWPESPLRVAVEIDADAPEEGVLGLEFADGVQEGPHPVLGATLLRAR